MCLEMRDQLVKRQGNEQAKISRTRNGVRRFRFELAPTLVQIDLMRAEAQSHAPSAEGDDLHTQDAGIEIHRVFNAFDGEHEVIDAVYVEVRRHGNVVTKAY